MNQAKKLMATKIFLAVQILLYLYFMMMDVISPMDITSGAKYAIILLCLCMLFFYGIIAEHKHFFIDRYYRTIVLALLFTAISDYFLLLDGPYLVGMVFFAVAQQIHGLHLDCIYHKVTFLCRLFLQLTIAAITCLICFRMKIGLQPIVIITIFYFISLLTNVIRAVLCYKQDRTRFDARCLAIGFLLFLFCDINVGLYNLSDYVGVNAAWLSTGFHYFEYLMWTFYAPSQVMIVLSASKGFHIRKHEKYEK